MSVLMGANVANEVAKGDFAEATIGCTALSTGAKWCKLFNTSDFKVAKPFRPRTPRPAPPPHGQPQLLDTSAFPRRAMHCAHSRAAEAV